MSVTTYNVEAGKDRAIIEISDETKVVFSFDPNIIAVEAVSGEVNVSLDEGAETGDDGCDTLSEGQSTRMNPISDKCIYVNGTGTVKVWGGRSGEDCPFNSGKRGGGSGGTTNYKGTTTTALSDGSTANPILINGEEYTAVFGDIVVYSYTEFIFDGTQWSEFGRPFDTVDYSTTERLIGKWIDGSDLYQRTFEITSGLTKNVWNNDVLGTTGIEIKEYTGNIYWLYNSNANVTVPINSFRSLSEYCTTYIVVDKDDLNVLPFMGETGMSIDKAVITIKYTKTIQANVQQGETREEPIVEDDMR